MFVAMVSQFSVVFFDLVQQVWRQTSPVLLNLSLFIFHFISITLEIYVTNV